MKVPAGLYQIGVDIPAGYWTIKTNSYYATMIKYGNFLNKNKNEIDYPYVWDYIVTPSSKKFYNNCPIELSWRMEDGYFFSTDSTVTFTPYQGANLNFK